MGKKYSSLTVHASHFRWKLLDFVIGDVKLDDSIKISYCAWKGGELVVRHILIRVR